jgi:amino acid transporter
MTTDALLPGVGQAQQHHRLAGKLGPTAIVFMVVAAAAPLTVVAGTFPIGIAAGNGAAFPASYIVCTAVLLLFAVGFTAMARHIRGAGAFYTYIAHGFGRHVGLGAAFLALLSYTAVQGGVYGYVGASMNELVTSHGGPAVPWYLYALVMMAVVGTLGYRHIELSGKVLGVLLICEVGIVMVINIAVIGKGGDSGLSSAVLHPGNFFAGAPGIALIFALAGYIGFEATAVFRDEARDPARTIPRATYVALLLIGGFYALSSWVLVSAWGDEGAVTAATNNPANMLTDTATRYVGTVAGDLVQIFLITSLFAALLSFHNVLARYIFSLGNTRALPERCGRSHLRHDSPHIASAVQTVSALVLVVASVLCQLDPVTQVFTWFVGAASVGIVVLMTLTSAAVIVYFRRTRFDTRPWNTVIAPGLGFVGLAILSVMTAINLPLLVGGSATLAAIIGVLLAGAFLSGGVVAVLRPHAGHQNDTPGSVTDAQTDKEIAR